MQYVDKAPFQPGECLVRHSCTGPFVDLQAEFDHRHNGRMYVSEEAIRQMAKLCGFVPDQSERIAELEKELEAKQEEIERHERFRAQVNNMGLVFKKKVGRPPKNKEAAVNGS